MKQPFPARKTILLMKALFIWRNMKQSDDSLMGFEVSALYIASANWTKYSTSPDSHEIVLKCIKGYSADDKGRQFLL